MVSDRRALDEQIAQVRARYGAVLVERFIAGREFNAAVVALPEPRLLPLAEIEFAAALSPRERLVTYAAKWDSGSAADLATAPRCPARVERSLGQRIEQAALAAFEATGCRDYARVDLRVADDQSIYILEINGNPDIGPRPVSPGRWARRESATASSSTVWCGTQPGGGRSAAADLIA